MTNSNLLGEEVLEFQSVAEIEAIATEDKLDLQPSIASLMLVSEGFKPMILLSMASIKIGLKDGSHRS